MNKASYRIADPVLTGVALGYVDPQFIGGELFPTVFVPSRGGKVVEFGKDNFKVVDTVRAPGATTKRITVGYGSQVFALIDHSLDAQVPREYVEEGKSGADVDLMGPAVNDVQVTIMRNLEIQQAALATDPANYGTDNKINLVDGSRFNDAGTDPGPIFSAAILAIRKKVGLKPNKAIIPTEVIEALKRNPFVQAQVQYVGSETPTVAKVTLAMLAAYIGVKKVVEAESLVNDGSDDLADIWGFSVVLAWVNDAATNNRQPNFGYTYRLRNYPYVEPAYYDKATKSWLAGFTDSREAYITMPDAGYLIENASD